MKLRIILALIGWSYAAGASDVLILDIGPHHRTIGRIHTVTNLAGDAVTVTNSYVEIGSGLNYLKGSQWLPATPTVIPDPEGAIVTNAAYSAKFKSNLKDAEPAVFTTPDGQVLRTRVMGLSYFDSSSGEAVLLAETRDCEGQIVSSNRVVYSQAFDDVRADVEYVMSKGGWEQNVIVRADIPEPSVFGMNPATTRLQILTEFVSPPENEAVGRRASADGLVDQAVKFGNMQIQRGKAFPVNSRAKDAKDVHISKLFKKLGNQHFLLEEMQFTNARPHLKALPVRAEGASLHKPRRGKGADAVVALRSYLRSPVIASTRPSSLQLASLSLRETSGFLCDYSTLANITNFTFSGNTNYYVASPVSLSGHTVIEGGTVIKSGVPGWPDYPEAAIIFNDPQGTLDCRTSPYKPAVFTSANDNTIGESIANSTGTPAQGDYLSALIFNYGPGVELHDLRVVYAATAFQFLGYDSARLCNNQIVNCGQGVILTGGGYFGNNLFAGVSEVFAAYDDFSSVVGENLTVDGGTLFSSGYYELEHTFKNSLFKNVTLPEFYTTQILNKTAVATDFAMAGAGNYYLAGSSGCRDSGTADLDTGLRLSLKQKTTSVPILLSNIISAENVVLLPQAQRDTDAPDVGYHYDPIDYICAWFAVTNADPALDVSLAMSSGVVVANFDETGILLRNSVAFRSIGLPTCPNRFVDYRTVQEQPVKIGSYANNSMSIPVHAARGDTESDSFTCRFTHFSRPAGTSYGACNIIAINNGFSVTTLDVQDCEFLNGDIQVSFGVLNSFIFRNNLLQDASVCVWGTTPLEFANNTIRSRYVSFEQYTPAPWEVRDNIFLRLVCIEEFGDYEINHHHNAYVNSTNVFFFTPLNPNEDLVLGSFAWQQGPLGAFYVLTNSPVLNVGSYSSAGLGGLYHQTMTTNQVKDANSRLDIGRHYVALGLDGRASDADGDGLPDYLEDANGDGQTGAGETCWQAYNSLNGLSAGQGLHVFTPLK